MSIASRVTVRRLLGTGAASLALAAASVGGASGAWAHGGGGDGWGSGHYRPGSGAGTVTESEGCQFSLNGTDFFPSVKVDDQNLKPTDDGKIHIKVRTAGDASTCTASLASYTAHGPTFATSGQQVLVDFDTATVKKGQTDSLDIAVPDEGCFAQIDLYRGAVKFDGNPAAGDGLVHGDLPKGPDHPVIKDKLIAAWNGGTKDCTTKESPSPSAPASVPPSAPESTPPASESSTPAPSASESTPESTPTPAASGSSSAPATAPSPNGGGGGDLAETGGGSNTGPLVGGAAVLLAGGAAIVVATRRRRASHS
ncbi:MULTISPECIES: LAETG motif-containing sortase-dependent surface protein [unclassified Streptomyces]|uniref:LAETG motif-containing sortase-dependent surface protein n=1 Tax=unclassified Streptomyces TaxID=2593676 RepID=UPI00403C3AFB